MQLDSWARTLLSAPRQSHTLHVMSTLWHFGRLQGTAVTTVPPITWEIRPGFPSDLSPKLWDKIQNGKPGFKAKKVMHCERNQTSAGMAIGITEQKPGKTRWSMAPTSTCMYSNWISYFFRPVFFCSSHLRCIKSLQCNIVLSPNPTLSRGETVWWTIVEFLGLAHALRQCNLATIKTFCSQPAQKRYGCSNGDEQILPL